MAEIVRTYAQSAPAMRFIGRRYGNQDRQDGSFSHLWDMWFSQGMFEPLEKLSAPIPGYEDQDAYLGLMQCKDGDDAFFAYWIGMLLPPETPVPEGYEALDLPANTMHVAWVKGKEETGDVYCKEEMCLQALSENGLATRPQSGMWLCMERYQCPRFTTPDQEGNMILDMCFLNQ